MSIAELLSEIEDELDKDEIDPDVIQSRIDDIREELGIEIEEEMEA